MEITKLCPKCLRQAYQIETDRHGIILKGECLLCGHSYDSGITKDEADEQDANTISFRK